MPNITSFPTGNVGIGTDNPQRNLHVAGTMRLTGSTGTGSTAIMGRDGSGDIGNVGVGTGLQLTNGTLSLTGATGTGTTNYLTKWSSATGLTDSIVLETGNTIDIAGSLRVRTSSGTATAVMGRDVNGYVSNITTGTGLQISNGTLSLTGATGTGTTGIVPRWASSSGLTDSIIFSTGTVVGINTTNPQATLDVRGTMRLTGSTGSPVTTIMGRNANGDISNATIGTGLQLTNGTLSLTGATGTGTTNYLSKWASATGLTDSIVLETGNTIDIAGSLRVRTSSGTATAVMGRDVNGYVSNIAVGSGLSVSGGTLSTTGVTFGTGADGRVAYWIGTGVTNQIGNDNNFIWDYDNDRLGIGVFPTSALHISSANSASIRLVKTGASPADFSFVALNGKLDIGSAFTITDTGRLGLGTNAPAQTLDVAGTMRLTGSTGSPVTTIMGRNANGDISNAAIGTGLQLTNGTLSLTGATGTGTTNYLSKWASATGLTDSIVIETGNTIDISGSLRVRTSSGTATLIAGQDANGYFSRITVGSGLSLSGNTLTTTGSTGVSGSGTATQVAFWNGTTSLTGNTNLYWDNSNNRLGIGTSSPSNQLTTTGDASIGTLTIGRGNNSIPNNTAIGASALLNNPSTLASGNTAVGYFTLSSTTTGGSFNSAFGNLALSKTTTGNSNTAAGSDTLTENTTGNSNTAVGRAALSNNTSGGSNVGVGSNALSNNGSGSSSVAVGASAGSLSAAGTNLTTANSSIFIGASSRASNISPSNQIVIGTNAVGLADNATVIGTTGTTQTHLHGNLTLGLTSADTTARVKATSSDGSSSSFAAKFQNNSGTDILSVRGDGLVGVGTNAPAQTLDIRGTMRLTGSTGDSTTVMGRNANGDVSAISVGSGLSLSGNTLTTTGSTGVSGSGTATQVAFWNGTTSLTSNTNLYWDNNNSRLGIGTTTPSACLQVVGTGTTTGTTFLAQASGGTEIFRILDNGNVGIGTNSPNRNISILANTPSIGLTSNSQTSITSIGLTNDSTTTLSSNVYGSTRTGLIRDVTVAGKAAILSSADMFINVNSNLYIGTNTVEYFRATSNGVGIGTTSPTSRLHVRGSGTTTGTTFLTQASGGTETFRILDNGNVGVNFASPTARLYVKGSTSGNGSTAFEVTDNNDRDIINVRDDGRIALGRNLSILSQSSVTIEAVGTEADINVAIVPKGTGAFTLAIPDNTSIGGNARGQYAVDLQTNRSSLSQVASGLVSVISGGKNNNATGSYSSINGGLNNYTLSDYSSICGGIDTFSYLHGQSSISSGMFATQGDAQTSNIRLRREITGSGQTELFLNGSNLAARLTTANKVWLANIFLVATVQNIGTNEIATGDTFSGSYIVTIKRRGSTTSLVGTGVHTEATVSDSSMSTSVVTIDANDSNDSLRIQFTPPSNFSATTVTRVVATVYLTEVGF